MAAIIGSIVTPLGLIFTVHQYTSQQRTASEQATLDLYIKYLEDPILKTRLSLDVFYNPVESQKYLSAIEDLKSKKDHKSLEKFTETFSKEKEKQILTLTSFYEGIVNCVDTTMKKQLEAYLRRTYKSLSSYSNRSSVTCAKT